MSSNTGIEWTDTTWNPTRGCSRVSPGCQRCYAERMAARFSGSGNWGEGFAEMTPSGPRWTGAVELVEDKLLEPLSWRKPRRIFVNSTSDLFHESLSDEDIDRVFAVMAMAPQHTFQVLTKRAERMRDWMETQWRPAAIERAAPERYVPIPWPPPNVQLGVSVEDQQRADERIPHLIATPAAVRIISAEPLLGPLSIEHWLRARCEGCGEYRADDHSVICYDEATPYQGYACGPIRPGLDWVIVGGESGPGARPCEVAWVASVVEQCASASVACFVKQFGAMSVEAPCRPEQTTDTERARWLAEGWTRILDARGEAWSRARRLRDPKGGDPAEWPDRQSGQPWPRQFPEA